MSAVTFQIWRRNRAAGAFVEYKTEVTEGMVVLDVIHKIQAEQANDMAVRWNCKAGKCGSCSAEIMLGENHWHAEADVHDADEHAAAGPAGARGTDEEVPADSRSGAGRELE